MCGSKSAIFVILSSLGLFCPNNDNSKMVQVLTVILSQNCWLTQPGAIPQLSIFIAPNSPWSIKLFTALPGCCSLRRTPFSNVVCMRTRSLVSKPKTTVIGLGEWYTRKISALTSTACGWHGLSRSRLKWPRLMLCTPPR